MTELKAEVDPADLGLAADRLRRLNDHFRRYVDDGRLKGWLLTVSRRGKLAYTASYGQRDAEAGLPVEPDTLWRIYSMTKPVTSVAAMMLYEGGTFELTDPVSRFIPSFKDMRVFAGGTDRRPVTIPAAEPVRIWHLLTHTAGLTFATHRNHPVDAMYRAAGFTVGHRPNSTLEEACELWGKLPLLFQPGTAWNYSVATDVLGRVVEVASGQSLDEFFAQRIFGPLGMTDTGFYTKPDDLHRLATLYTDGPNGKAARYDDIADEARKPPVLLSGGGLVSTAADYDRFLHMLLPLPDSSAGEDLEQFSVPPSESAYRGVGWGLGFAVVIDPVVGRVVGSVGELSWQGAACTPFWIDPSRRAQRGLLHPAAPVQPATPLPVAPARLPGTCVKSDTERKQPPPFGTIRTVTRRYGWIKFTEAGAVLGNS